VPVTFSTASVTGVVERSYFENYCGDVFEER